MRKDLLNGLTDEQIAKVKACRTQDEVLTLARNEGIELTDEQLAAVSGGGCFSTIKCPKCGSTKHYKEEHIVGFGGSSTQKFYICKDCGHKWLP